jgi:hypothetical protein
MMARSLRSSNRARGRHGVVLALLGTLGAQARANEAATVPPCPSSPVVGGEAGAPPNNVRLVTGVPYSARGTSETVTTLPDGNRVVRQNTIRLWRDSDGRTRSEFSLSSIGGPRPLELNTTVTVIDDPEARERYLMQPGDKVAHTLPIVPCRVDVGLEPDLSVGPPRPPGLPMKVSKPVKLGERKVDGETIAGSRVEATIPAGAIGNEQPIKMSAEQWYGKDLQVVVEATYRDPRTGETRYKLSDIRRAEPDAKLFRVPDNYTKQPGPPRKRR